MYEVPGLVAGLQNEMKDCTRHGMYVRAARRIRSSIPIVGVAMGPKSLSGFRA